MRWYMYRHSLPGIRDIACTRGGHFMSHHLTNACWAFQLKFYKIKVDADASS